MSKKEYWIAVDASGSPASVALEYDGPIHMRCVEGTASDRLLLTLLELLQEHGLSLDDVTHLACHQGPGGFTGLRIGASVMQGISWGLQRPLWGACGLEAVAEAYRRHHQETFKHAKVWVVQDARLGEVFWAQFEWINDEWRCHQPPQLNRPEDMTIPLSSDWIGVGSGWAAFPDLQKLYAEKLVTVDGNVISNASAILSVARRWAKSGVAGQIGRIELNYLRDRVAQTIEERLQSKGMSSQKS